MVSTDPHHALKRGYVLNDYTIEGVIGSGGFGITYKAKDPVLKKSVAIKEYIPADIAVRLDDTTIVPKSQKDEDDYNWGLERFLDEAQLLVKFDHKNIVSVLRFIEAHGTAYIVMEYVDGETLSDILKREGTLPYTQLRSIIDPVMAGLAVVHQGDFLHRDIKPGNIIIRENGTPVLIDFGAARQAVGVRSRSVTAIVTPGYAPIEQYDTSGNQGAWTDIYALGAICYRAITGKRPDDATGRIRRDPLVSLMEQDVPKTLGYPEPFLMAVDKALSVDEEGRPQSISEWRDISSGVVDEMAKTEYLPRKAKNLPSEPIPIPAHETNMGGSKPKAGLIFGGIAAVAVAGLAIGVLSFNGKAGPDPEEPTIVAQPLISPELAEAWGAAKALDSIESYETFLREWPNSEYANEARSSIKRLKERSDNEAFETAKAKGLVSGFGEYVQNYPDGKHHVAADDEAWQSAQRQNTKLAYDAYLKYFPQGQHTDGVEESRNELNKTCEGGNLNDCIRKGELFFDQNRYDLSLPLFQKACDADYNSACNKLGEMYQDGLGVSLDYSRARSLYSKTCDDDDMNGCNGLGFLYRHGLGVAVDIDRARTLYRKSCDGGDPSGCSNFGFLFLKGIGVSIDYSRARSLFSKACDGGDLAGCNNFGFLFLMGHGVSVDYSHARSLFSKACNGGEMSGCDNLGWLYQEGLGVSEDYSRAKSFYTKACDGDNMNGCNNLGWLYQEGLGVSEDYSRAKSFYTKACDGDNMNGCNNLGWLYQKGLGVSEDYNRARSFYTKACDGYDMIGCDNLGFIYQKGLGVSVDYSRARSFYIKACDREYMSACGNLGWMHQYGLGGSIDYGSARSLYTKACDGGDKNSCDYLASLR